MNTTTLDERDTALLEQYRASMDALPAKLPRIGDWVRFADGVVRRIGYIWRDENGVRLPGGVQTSDGGSHHLGAYGCGMSGSLYTGVDAETLTPTNETKEGSVWFFHHNLARPDGAVDTSIPFRVFACSLASTVTR